MIEKGPELYGILDNEINYLVLDYRAGRIDDATFRLKLDAWKTNWQQRIAEIAPGHTVEMLVEGKSRMPVFRFKENTEKPVDPATGLPKHLTPEPVAAAWRGPSR